MHDRVVSQRDSREIVTVDNWRSKGHMKLSEKSLHPEKLCCSMGQASVLSFSAGASNNWLLAGPPRDKVGPKVNGSTRGAPSIIRVRSPISITEGLSGGEVRGSSRGEM
jgi:hypothetical protein